MGNVEIVPDVVTIFRRNGQRVIRYRVLFPLECTKVLSDFQNRLAASDFQLPPGYSSKYGGEEGERGDALSNLISTVGVLLIMMIASLVLTFNVFSVGWHYYGGCDFISKLKHAQLCLIILLALPQF